MQNTPHPDRPGYQPGWINDFLVATVFLTRLPIRLRFHFSMPALMTACRAFPLVGVIVGGLSGGVFWLATLIGLPALPAAFLALAAQALVTGALHEDAIGDVADGFGGGGTRDKKMEIMRDSRVGTYAVVTLILLIGLKAAAISSLGDPLQVLVILMIAAAVSRGMIVWALRFLPAARTDGLGASAGKPSLVTCLWSLGLCVLLTLLCVGVVQGAVLLLAGTLGAALMAEIARRQIGGQTGDVLGSIQQISETVILLAALSLISA
ncbi:adenosylcobinamide-GDP ribazoletransferase [Sneathiella chinensis]|uniref:Adenosylcobinamide-GDP ribazoletransferase n=1 Tax=Sneathiella chinensis TaxID=349750 RepID=A0ABQ5U6P6_9PROT|nr:adenosylcobinamide-GDP ribazoletransferase [Sneathiella chinensis]GLQ06161.1 adenosylcobinamide-GDP ribazoletransferase [Sneathiella chinensis]